MHLFRSGPQEVAQTETNEKSVKSELNQVIQDSIQSQQKIIAYGDLGYFFVPNDLPNIKFSTKSMIVEIQSKGAEIHTLSLREFENYDDLPIPMIKDENSKFNVSLYTKDGRVLNTRDFYFKTKFSERDNEYIILLKSAISKDIFVVFEYIFPKNGYTFTVDFKSVGMETLLDSNKPPEINWSTNIFRNSRSIDYENRYTELTFGYEGDRVDYLSLSGDDEENREDIRWISYRQHFFSAILIPDSSIKTINLKSKDLSGDQSLEEKFTKYFESSYLLPKQGENINTKFKFYYGPTDYKTLQNLEGDLEASIPMGWGIFGWVNKFMIGPIFNFIKTWGVGFGLAILLLTLIVKIIIMPLTYKNYVSSAKMKVLKPEITKLNSKFEGKTDKNTAMKKQQETMALYRQTGVNPMAGCIPVVIQMPILFAVFRYFPASLDLRHQGFLWAEDLSSFDSILELGFEIPFYGDHISLFTLLMAASTLFYTMMNSNQMTPSGPGMPNMKVIMYMFPIMMLFFFNTYSSGLSYYYLCGNVMNMGIMWGIKKYMVDEEKIRAQIEQNKKKPKKKSRFQQRMEDIAKQQQKKKR